MMKQKAGAFLAVLVAIALGISAWLYGYHHQKSTDNLPTLSSVAAMKEEQASELLVGYRRVQLGYVWPEPDASSQDEDTWKVGGVTLTVRYGEGDKVVGCRFSPAG